MPPTKRLIEDQKEPDPSKKPRVEEEKEGDAEVPEPNGYDNEEAKSAHKEHMKLLANSDSNPFVPCACCHVNNDDHTLVPHSLRVRTVARMTFRAPIGTAHGEVRAMSAGGMRLCCVRSCSNELPCMCMQHYTTKCTLETHVRIFLHECGGPVACLSA